MSYKESNTLAFAGQISKVGEALSRATGEQNVGATVVAAGRFVAIASPHGIKALSAVTDRLAGVVVKSHLQTTYQQDEYLSVGKVGHGDGIWVVLEGEAQRGDLVHVRVVAGEDLPTGSVSAAAIADGETPQSIETDLVIINVADGLAEVTRKE